MSSLKIKLHLSRSTIWIIVLIAFLFRLFLVFTFDTNKINNDGHEYHRIAVNVVLNNAYSLDTIPSYTKTFYREPGYPLFISGAYFLYNKFYDKISYIDNSKFNEKYGTFTFVNHEIFFIKILQSILDSLTIYFLFLTFLLFLDLRKSLIISLVLALFFPSAIHCTTLIREILLTFIMTVFTYVFALYIMKKKNKHLIISAVLWGISLTIFQAMILVPVLIFIIMVLNGRILPSLKHTLAFSFIGIIIIIPWIIRSYLYYPDIRVVKTLGNSLTYEMNQHTFALRKLVYYGLLTNTKLDTSKDERISVWKKFYIPSNQQFERSFNGYYKNLADSLENLRPENKAELIKRIIVTGASQFRHSWFYDRDYFPKMNKKKLEPQKILLMLIPLAVGLMAILGFILFYRKYYIFTFSFTYFMSLFFLIGDHTRRMLPARPFLILFCCLALFFLYDKFKTIYTRRQTKNAE